jgi:small-conductance mechanosensitive channel
MSDLRLALLASIGELFRRLGEILRIDAEELIRDGARVLGIWLLAYFAYRIVRIAARRIEIAVDDGDDSVTTLRERRGQTIAQLLRSVGRVAIIAIATLLTFNIFIDIGPILAGAGILGLAVSFGAQSLVKDVISGFFILFENQYLVGDVVQIGDALQQLGGSARPVEFGTIDEVRGTRVTPPPPRRDAARATWPRWTSAGGGGTTRPGRC